MSAFAAVAPLGTFARWGFHKLRGKTLQRLFSTFPDGWPGVALFLLRLTIGVTAAVQGGLYLFHGSSWTLKIVLLCVLLVTCGICLLIGFLTPVAGLFVAICGAGMALSWLPLPGGNLLERTPASFVVVVVAVAVALLGPGAYSLDARLFGRHEIVIPPGPRGSKLQ